MTYPFASAPARLVGRVLATATTAALVTVFAAATVMAQQPAAPAPAPAKPAAPRAPAAAPKPAPAKPAAPAAQAPAAQPPAAPAAPGAQAGAQQPQQPPLIYSPWTKFCLKASQEANAKQVCFTGIDGRLESGQPVVAAVLIEPDAPEARKVLRVTVPLGVQLIHGTRVIIDQNPPMQGPFVICFTNGCMADYEATPAMIATMKKGQGLSVQAINANGQWFNIVLSLAGLGKALEGPPTDPKVFEEQQKKLQEELQKRAVEARQKLEAAQPQKTQ
jgi:invasion protein IalB